MISELTKQLQLTQFCYASNTAPKTRFQAGTVRKLGCFDSPRKVLETAVLPRFPRDAELNPEHRNSEAAGRDISGGSEHAEVRKRNPLFQLLVFFTKTNMQNTPISPSPFSSNCRISQARQSRDSEQSQKAEPKGQRKPTRKPLSSLLILWFFTGTPQNTQRPEPRSNFQPSKTENQ